MRILLPCCAVPNGRRKKRVRLYQSGRPNRKEIHADTYQNASRPCFSIRKEINQIKFTSSIIIIIIIWNEKLDARACRRIDFRLEITTIYDFLFMRDRNCFHRRYVRCVRLIRFGDKTVWPCGWLSRHPLNISSRKTSQMKKRNEKHNRRHVRSVAYYAIQLAISIQIHFHLWANHFKSLALAYVLLLVPSQSHSTIEWTASQTMRKKKKVHYFIVISLSKCKHIHAAAIRMHAKCWMRFFYGIIYIWH